MPPFPSPSPFPNTTIVGIAGGTGAGKTTIAQHLMDALPPGQARLIPHDAYYRDRSDLSDAQRELLNFDHPEALDTKLLIEHLNHLRSGNTIHIPDYDFVSHTRKADWIQTPPAPVILVEGIMVLVDPRLRKLFDIKLFVDTQDDIRVLRRFNRDINERGRSFDSVRRQYLETVRPMHVEHVEPSRQHADLIIPEGGDNTVALRVLITTLASIRPNPADKGPDGRQE